MSRHRILSPAEIKQQVAKGEPIVIHEGHILHLGELINRHPGGRLAILHMVGRDATDEINVYHSRKTLLMMTKHRIGRLELPWANLEPPIRHQDYFKNLEKRKLEKKGTLRQTYDENPEREPYHDLGYVVSNSEKQSIKRDVGMRRRTSRQEDNPEKLPLAFESTTSTVNAAENKKRHRVQFVIEQEKREAQEGMYENASLDTETQNAIIMEYPHDAGHRVITGNFVYDTLIAAFIGDFCYSLSIGWWKSSHNIHHLVTNMPEHDPDIQNVPLFSTTPTYMKSINSSFYNFRFMWEAACDLLVPHQKWWYYPIMAFARFNLYILGWLHLFSPRVAQVGAAWWTRYLEIVFMCCYWYLYGYLLVWLTLPTWSIRVGFILISHMVTVVLQVQITLSHWGIPTSDLGPTELSRHGKCALPWTSTALHGWTGFTVVCNSRQSIICSPGSQDTISVEAKSWSAHFPKRLA